MERISSGNDVLDSILDGGFPANSINIIMGLPGTGKTILAEKVVFSNASVERPALYIATVSEPLDKMIRYLQEFDYFDPEAIGDSVIYEDLSDTLRLKDLGTFVAEIVSLVKEHNPSFLVIDSFKALHAFSTSAGEFRTAISQLMNTLSSLAITSFLVGEYTSAEIASMPEFAVADGIVELVLKKVGSRDVRYLRVVKERGAQFRNGEHAFKIDRSGLLVFERTVTPPDAIPYELVNTRDKTGVAVFDEMVADGFWRGASTIVFGPPGSGKTLLGLHFIFKGIEMGRKGLIATMEENPTQLRRIISGFGWDMQKAIDDGMLELYYVSPVDLYIDEFITTIKDMTLTSGAERVMIDSLSDLISSEPDAGRFRDYIYSLVQTMSTVGISLYMTAEMNNLFATTVTTEFGVSHMSDNIVLIHYVRQDSEIKRAISVVKTRASMHDPRIRQFVITSEGLRIGDVFSDSYFGSST